MERKATIFDLVRMLKATKVCESCPVDAVCNKSKPMCEADYIYDDLNEEVLKWCDEYPAKTYKRDFLEKFPNNVLDEDEIPPICVYRLYGGEYCCSSSSDCKGCWNEEMGNERI